MGLRGDESGSTVVTVFVVAALAVVVFVVLLADRLPVVVLIAVCVACGVGGIALLVWAIRDPQRAPVEPVGEAPGAHR